MRLRPAGAARAQGAGLGAGLDDGVDVCPLDTICAKLVGGV